MLGSCVQYFVLAQFTGHFAIKIGIDVEFGNRNLIKNQTAKITTKKDGHFRINDCSFE